MGKLKWYKRDPNAALSGMMELTLEERGAYNTVLDLIYARDNDLPDDDRFIAGWLRVDVRVWKRIKTTLIDRGKLYLRDGLICNTRADVEVLAGLSRCLSVADARRTSQAKSVAVRNKNKELALANDLQKNCTTTTTPTEVKKDSLSESPKKASDSTASHQCEATPEDGNDGRHGSGSEGYRSSKEPARSNTGQSKARVPRGTRCPWISSSSIPGECQEFARQLGLDPQAVGERFTDYWRAAPGSRGVKLDWSATWRNWCRREVERPQAKRTANLHSIVRDAFNADARADYQPPARTQRADQAPGRGSGRNALEVERIPRETCIDACDCGDEGDQGMAGLPRLVAYMGRT